MSINPQKCYSLCTFIHPKKYITRSNPTYDIARTTVVPVTAINPFKYLGHYFGPGGMGKLNISHLPIWLRNIGRACLKSDQKSTKPNDHFIPKLLHGLQATKLTAARLKGVDKVTRLWTKKHRHLNICTPDVAIYARVRDGGFGILELRTLIPKIMCRGIDKLSKSDNDSIISKLCKTNYILNIRDNLQRCLHQFQ